MVVGVMAGKELGDSVKNMLRLLEVGDFWMLSNCKVTFCAYLQNDDPLANLSATKHSNPESILHVELHPSKSTKFPSSQFSYPTTQSPSPHVYTLQTFVTGS